ncbi:5-carboxymethyl-2-hydroxymuconate isomerase [Hypericibacter adhaerens]|uniref:5-carboxymethyl-2-hydroxymuconate isomerase n=1 Tax=Hypericibacter adhaerens TaxID=2602016 RepID=A0A5J6N3M1_9PROT|nr:fumarylacetoacetate hydrolase family protein [Hypericibacter adhaerens]QEX24622.1 5-carboxymethyl-2-hydroxymuconate isomerase [Hypericibacter adhaerens]
MKLVSYTHKGRSSWGAAAGTGLVDMGKRLPDLPSLRSALAANAQGRIAAALKGATADLPLSEARLLPPIPDPEKVICFGNNYREHVLEAGGKIPEHPSLFVRLANTLVGHEAPIIVPRVSSDLDYETELALVIGKPGRHIPAAKAFDHIAGYTCFHDASVRDFQLLHSLDAGKNFIGTGPCGPWIVTRDEIPNPGNLTLRTRLNGTLLQNGNTSELIFDIPAMIAYISSFTPLAPGDIIATGTPSGVGFTRKPPIWLKPGDVVEIEVEGIGILRNPVRAEGDEG